MNRAAHISVAVLLSLIAWRDIGLAPVLEDEQAYLVGIGAVAAGGSSYEADFGGAPPWVYPPPVANAAAFLVASSGHDLTRWALRLLCFGGALALGWLIATHYRLRWPALSAAALAVGGGTLALEHGNASPAVIALAFWALTRERDELAGAWLGVALALKPLFVPALPALLLWRRRAGLWACVTAGALVVAAGPVELARWLELLGSRADHWAHASENLSAHAALWRAGVEVPAIVWAGAVGLAAAWFARGPAGMLLACAAGTAVLWPGTLVPLALPALASRWPWRGERAVEAAEVDPRQRDLFGGGDDA